LARSGCPAATALHVPAPFKSQRWQLPQLALLQHTPLIQLPEAQRPVPHATPFAVNGVQDADPGAVLYPFTQLAHEPEFWVVLYVPMGQATQSRCVVPDPSLPTFVPARQMLRATQADAELPSESQVSAPTPQVCLGAVPPAQ